MSRMPSCRTILQRLRNCDEYLSNHHLSHQSAFFEELIIQGFACLLHLPFYDADNDDGTILHKATWFGSKSSKMKAPRGPDGIANAYEYRIVIEATRKSGKNQWSQEFAQCLDHAKEVSSNFDVDAENLYTVLLTVKIHEYTYQSVKASNRTNRYRIIPLEIGILETIVETSLLAFTIRHIEVRRLFLDILDCLSRSTDLANFHERTERCVEEWQKKVLELEMGVTVAIKSYEAMVKIGRDYVGVSEILARLKKHPIVRRYFARLESAIVPDLITESLVQESLGIMVKKIPTTGEELFCPVPFSDFKSRCERRLKTVENIRA